MRSDTDLCGPSFDVTSHVHAVVKHTKNIDKTCFALPKDKDVTTSPPVSRNVKNKNIRLNVIAAFDAYYTRSIDERFQCLSQRFRIDLGLLRAESLSCPGQNICNILFGLTGKADRPRGHQRDDEACLINSAMCVRIALADSSVV